MGEQQCATRTVQECTNIVKEVPEQQCTTVADNQCTNEEQCTTETQTVVDVTYTQECQDIVRQVCTETRVAVQTHSAIVGHAVAAAPQVVAAAPQALAAAPQVIPQLQAGIVPQAIDGIIAQRLVKRDADAE